MKPELEAMAERIVDQGWWSISMPGAYLGIYALGLAAFIYINLQIGWSLLWKRAYWPFTKFRNLGSEIGDLIAWNTTLPLKTSIVFLACLIGIAPFVVASEATPIGLDWAEALIPVCILGASGVLETWHKVK